MKREHSLHSLLATDDSSEAPLGVYRHGASTNPHVMPQIRRARTLRSQRKNRNNQSMRQINISGGQQSKQTKLSGRKSPRNFKDGLSLDSEQETENQVPLKLNSSLQNTSGLFKLPNNPGVKQRSGLFKKNEGGVKVSSNKTKTTIRKTFRGAKTLFRKKKGNKKDRKESTDKDSVITKESFPHNLPHTTSARSVLMGLNEQQRASHPPKVKPVRKKQNTLFRKKKKNQAKKTQYRMSQIIVTPVTSDNWNSTGVSDEPQAPGIKRRESFEPFTSFRETLAPSRLSDEMSIDEVKKEFSSFGFGASSRPPPSLAKQTSVVSMEEIDNLSV